MYDKLLKRLRNRRICIQKSGSLEDFPLLREAADAIEDLICEVAEEHNGRLDAEEKIPRWISVEERLPEGKKAHYLCLLDDDSMEVVYWSKVPDWASKGEWTWHNPNWKEVTHWMPLPQPPKE